MKKLKFFILMLAVSIVVTGFVFSAQIKPLPKVMRPDNMAVDGNELYVVEGAVVTVYSLKDSSTIRKFGKKGEGPGELKVVSMLPNNLKILDQKLFVDGMDKVIFFSKNFKFLKEIKKKYMTFKTVPVGNNFVAMRIVPYKKNIYHFVVLLLDREMNILKELHKQEYRETDTDIDMVLDSIHFSVYKDQIFIETSNKGFVIEIFDSNGSSQGVIRKKVRTQKITEADKKAILENFKEDNLVRMMVEREGGWKNFKNKMNFVFPDIFPPIQDIMVVQDKIYVSTYWQKNHTRKFIIMDLQGNILNSVYLPIPHESSFLTKTMGRDNRFFGITDNKYYYLTENTENEEWELQVTEIK